MTFDPPLVPAILQRRYKRFLADVLTADGRGLTVHCPNTGAMLGCASPGSAVWLAGSDNPKRKYRYTWELVRTVDGVLVGINTARSNALVREAMESDLIPELRGYRSIRAEVRYGRDSSRADFLLSDPVSGERECFVEVKNVTAAVQGGVALFPDAVSVRATRHLRELSAVVAGGARALLCYCVQRDDVDRVRPAELIDPAYARALSEAIAAGVEVVAYAASVTPRGLRLYRRLDVHRA